MGRYLRDLGLGPQLLVGPWFEFRDSEGPGCAQPDFVILRPSHVLLVEAKLTQTQVAFLQMSQLYVPILEKVYSRPVTLLQACRGLKYVPEAPARPEELLSRHVGGNFTWHFLGR